MKSYPWAALALVAGLAMPAHGQESEAEFSARVVPQLQAALPDATLQPNPGDPLAIRVSGLEGWDDATINLHRIFSYCASVDVDTCTAITGEYIANIAYRPPPPEQSDLRVLVRDGAYWTNIVETFGQSGSLPYHREIGEGLFAILAFDSPKSIMLAMPDTVTELGLDESEAWSLARQQTAAILPPLPDGTELRSNSTIFQDYEYLPSMLAETEAWEKISADAGPDLFATAVSDGFVFVGVMPSGPLLDGFRITVEEDCAAQPRCVSPHIYRFRNGKWVIAQ